VEWYYKNQFESGPGTADLSATVVYSFKSLRNIIKPVYELTQKVEDFSIHL